MMCRRSEKEVELQPIRILTTVLGNQFGLLIGIKRRLAKGVGSIPCFASPFSSNVVGCIYIGYIQDDTISVSRFGLAVRR